MIAIFEQIKYRCMRQEYATARALGFTAPEALRDALDVGADIRSIAESDLTPLPEFFRRYVIGGEQP